MTLQFGEYITKQYGLLKQILSYLEPIDLRNAKLVCREWSSAVESLLDKNPTTFRVCCGMPYFTKRTLPALVIHQNPPKLQCPHYLEKCRICKQTFLLCPCQISGPDTLFLSLDADCHDDIIGFHSLYSFWDTSCALVLPTSAQIQVSTFCIESKATTFMEPVTDEVVNLCTGGEEPIKCLIIISKATRISKTKWLNGLLNKIVERQGVTFAVGGGDIRSVMRKKGFSFTKEDNWKKSGTVLIALRGDSVSAYSDVLASFNKQHIDKFMKDMASKAGPVPEDGTRIAFIAQCVDRTNPSVESCESIAFQTAFPSVHQYGFHAYGEYGMRSSTSENTEQDRYSKRKKMTFEHTRTTSFTILTFKKV